MNIIKKLLITFALLFGTLSVFADTMPFYVKQIPSNAIGVFQTSKQLRLMAEPEANSHVIKQIDLSYDASTMPDETFAVLINEKQLGFLYVTDLADEDWYQVIYNKKTGARGWIKAEDSFQFLNWFNFYNMYGRKYGLRFLKDAPEDLKVLKSKSEEDAQNISKLNLIKNIKLTTVKGNWALVSVFDIDKTPKTGYMKWRGNDGTIFAFPNLK